jgi:hypothetical protein
MVNCNGLRAEPMSGENLWTLCRAFTEQPKAAVSYSCIFYVRGAYDALVLWDPFWENVCLPESFSTQTMTSTVIDYMRGNPKKRKESAMENIIAALQTAHPCRANEHRR